MPVIDAIMIFEVERSVVNVCILCASCVHPTFRSFQSVFDIWKAPILVHNYIYEGKGHAENCVYLNH